MGNEQWVSTDEAARILGVKKSALFKGRYLSLPRQKTQHEDGSPRTLLLRSACETMADEIKTVGKLWISRDEAASILGIRPLSFHNARYRHLKKKRGARQGKYGAPPVMFLRSEVEALRAEGRTAAPRGRGRAAPGATQEWLSRQQAADMLGIGYFSIGPAYARKIRKNGYKYCRADVERLAGKRQESGIDAAIRPLEPVTVPTTIQVAKPKAYVTHNQQKVAAANEILNGSTNAESLTRKFIADMKALPGVVDVEVRVHQVNEYR